MANTISNCPVRQCANGRDPTTEAMCSECWRRVPKTWRRWYVKDPSGERLAVLTHACFEEGARWGALGEDEREAIVQYAIRLTRQRWKHEPVDVPAAVGLCALYAVELEQWTVRAAAPAVRLFLALPSGKLWSAYAHRLDEIQDVMDRIRGAIDER